MHQRLFQVAKKAKASFQTRECYVGQPEQDIHERQGQRGDREFLDSFKEPMVHYRAAGLLP